MNFNFEENRFQLTFFLEFLSFFKCPSYVNKNMSIILNGDLDKAIKQLTMVNILFGTHMTLHSKHMHNLLFNCRKVFYHNFCCGKQEHNVISILSQNFSFYFQKKFSLFKWKFKRKTKQWQKKHTHKERKNEKKCKINEWRQLLLAFWSNVDHLLHCIELSWDNCHSNTTKNWRKNEKLSN